MSQQRHQVIKQIAEETLELRRLLIQHTHSPSKHLPTRAQVCILFALDRMDSVSIKQIASFLHITSSAATQVLEGLIQQKIVICLPDLRDRRRIRLSLTPKGKRVFQRVRSLHFAALIKLLQPLSDAELLQWRDLQRKIVHHGH